MHVQGHMEPSKSLRPSWAVFSDAKVLEDLRGQVPPESCSGPSKTSLGLVRGNCLSDWGGVAVCSEGCDGNVGVAAVRCVLLCRGQVYLLLEADRHRLRRHGVDLFRNTGQPINLFDCEPNHNHRYEPATTLVSMTAHS